MHNSLDKLSVSPMSLGAPHAGLQAQGDLLILPSAAPANTSWQAVPAKGAPLMQRAESPNHHAIVCNARKGGVAWASAAGTPVVAYLRVEDGCTAWLVHTRDHDPCCIGPGTYALHRKRQQSVSLQRDDDAQRKPGAAPVRTDDPRTFLAPFPRRARGAAWVQD